MSFGFQELLRGEGCVLDAELRWVRTLSGLRSSQVSMRVGSNVVLEVDVSMFLMFWDYFRSWFLIQFWRASVCLILLCLQCRLSFQFIPQQQNAMGFLHNRFRCVLGELGPFREGTGFREPVPVPGIRPRFRRFRCSMGSDRLGSVPEVWTEPVLELGSGNQRY